MGVLPSADPRGPTPTVPLVWGGQHTGALRSAVLAFKLGGRLALLDDLAGVLAVALAQLIPVGGRIHLVTVPLRRSSRRRRGIDIVSRLAARAGEHPVLADRRIHVRGGALSWVRPIPEQVGRDRRQRLRNPTGAMRAARPTLPPAVVVDDVVSSGGTLGEAVRAIRVLQPDLPLAAAALSRAPVA